MKSSFYDRFGEPSEVLQVRDADKPTPGPGEVLVRMIASPINPSDMMTVRGVYFERPPLPAVAGYEGVGVVEASGGG
ncbi:MAG: alcohol dehydrogenase catalytic domain-containing protein, partial [Planctomycetia bacterium]